MTIPDKCNIIVGLDISSSSPAIFWKCCDNDFNTITFDYRGISATKKHETEKTPHYKTADFKNYIEKYQKFEDILLNPLLRYVSMIPSSCRYDLYAAIEDYSFGSPGNLTLLAECAGNYKRILYNNCFKLRLYAPSHWKKMTTGRGDRDKLGIFETYQNIQKNYDGYGFVERDKLPYPEDGKKGISPTSDILDAHFLAEALTLELKIRNGQRNIENELPYIQESLGWNPKKKCYKDDSPIYDEFISKI